MRRHLGLPIVLLPMATACLGGPVPDGSAPVKPPAHAVPRGLPDVRAGVEALFSAKGERLPPICEANVSFVGTSIARETFETEDGWAGTGPYSRMTFRIDHAFTGPTSTFTLVTFGGPLPDGGWAYTSGAVSPSLGRTYAIAANVVPGTETDAPTGNLVFPGWVEIDPTAPLPAAAELDAVRERACGGRAGVERAD